MITLLLENIYHMIKKSKLMKYCNKLLVKYIDHDNFEIKNLLIEFRNVIIDELISI